MKKESLELVIKKQILTAWANILYKNSWIDYARLGKMVEMIEHPDRGKGNTKQDYIIRLPQLMVAGNTFQLTKYNGMI